MAKKILKIGSILASPLTGAASLISGGKKKKDEAPTASAAAAKKGPIITQLGRSAPPTPGAGTILSDKLGR